MLKLNKPDPALPWLNVPMYPAAPWDPKPRTWAEAWANRNAFTEPFIRRSWREKFKHEIDQPPASRPEPASAPDPGAECDF